MQQHKREVEFRLEDLLPIAFTLVVAGLGIAYGLEAMSDAKNDLGDQACSGYWNETGQKCDASSTNSTVISNNTDDYLAVSNASVGVLKLAQKFPTIAGISAAAVVIGILVTYLWLRR